MYLSAERIAVLDKAVQDTFEQSSVAWQAIPHWDTGDRGQLRVRSDYAHAVPTAVWPIRSVALRWSWKPRLSGSL